MYICLQTEPNLYTVGFYTPDNKWEPDSDYPTREEADDQVAILNGEAITKKRLPDLIKAYAKEDGSEGTATYRDIVTDLLHHAIKNKKDLSPEEAIELILDSAAKVFRKELTLKEEGFNT
jgi:hypothetical protein